MSNAEEESFLDGVQLPGEVADSIEARILGLGNDDGPYNPKDTGEVLQSFVAAEPVKAKFIPKVPKPAETSQTQPAKSDYTQEEVGLLEVKLLNQKIKDMEDAIKLLVAGRDGVKLKAVKAAKTIDWSSAKEADIFDMDIPIETVGTELPDYMNVTLKDSNFSPRWVHKMSRRLGPMKAKGYTFVKPEEIEGELNIAIEADENGVFRHDDVILMKIEKRLYYGMLRKNHEKALKMIDPKAAHKVAQNGIMDDLRSAKAGPTPEGTRPDLTRPGDFERYAESKKLEVYI